MAGFEPPQSVESMVDVPISPPGCGGCTSLRTVISRQYCLIRLRVRISRTPFGYLFFRQIFSLAPMMEYTDRHMRFLLRLLTTRTVLWTEMVPSTTIAHNADSLARFLDYNDEVEHPVVLQVRSLMVFVVDYPPRSFLRLNASAVQPYMYTRTAGFARDMFCDVEWCLLCRNASKTENQLFCGGTAYTTLSRGGDNRRKNP